MEAKYDFSNRVAIVTGAARGIGLATARRLASGGAKIAMLDRDTAALELALAGFNEGCARAWTIDMKDSAAVEIVFKEVRNDFGRIDILVNNAGIGGPSKPATEYSDVDWHRVMSVNLDGAFWACRAVVPTMVSAGWGRIVNVASIAGKEGNPNACAYSASKGGLIALTKSLAKELAKTGVAVNCVASAGVNTEILQQVSQEKVDYMLSRIPMGRFAEPEEVAALIAWLSSQECSFSTGAVYDLSGGRSTY